MIPITSQERRACSQSKGRPCNHKYHKFRKAPIPAPRMAGRGRSGAKGKFTAFGEASIPGFGSAGFSYASEKRAAKGYSKRNYFAPSSGIATSMKTAAQPVMTASRKGGAVRITQREILTTLNSSASLNSVFSLEVFDVNPGLSTICSWGSQIAKAFQQYEMSFRLVYTSSCPSTTSGQVLIAFDNNVGDPQLPQDKTQMSNFSGCVSSQVWAPMETGTVSSGSQFYIRDGPVPAGQSIQLYDFTKILLAQADTQYTEGGIVFGTVYIEYTLDLYLPRLTYSDESIIFSQLPVNDDTQTAAFIVDANYQTPVAALIGVPGSTANLQNFNNKTPLNVAGGLEVYAVTHSPVDSGVETPYFYLVFPNSGYYEVTCGCYSTTSTVVGGAPWVAWPGTTGSTGAWETGAATQISSFNNPEDLIAGAFITAGGSLPDDVQLTLQVFLVWVQTPGTLVDPNFNVIGDGWIGCPFDASYYIGTYENDNRIYSSFIDITPVSPGTVAFYNPPFYVAPVSSAMTGKEKLATQRRKVYSQRLQRKTLSSKASSSSASSSSPVMTDKEYEDYKAWKKWCKRQKEKSQEEDEAEVISHTLKSSF